MPDKADNVSHLEACGKPSAKASGSLPVSLPPGKPEAFGEPSGKPSTEDNESLPESLSSSTGEKPSRKPSASNSVSLPESLREAFASQGKKRKRRGSYPDKAPGGGGSLSSTPPTQNNTLPEISPKILAQWSDPIWRLSESGLYKIVDQTGQAVVFKPRPAQMDMLRSVAFRNVLLKARQLGFSTLIDLYILDACLFNSNLTAGIIAHRIEDVTGIFDTKVKFPYQHLPEAFLRARPAEKCDAHQLRLSNGSAIRVGLSMRSATIQLLHVSEYGKICARYPDKAEEIQSGTLPACHRGSMVFIESTAEGRVGDFFDLCRSSQAATAEALREGWPFGPEAWRFHFFPWFRQAEYSLPEDEACHIRIPESEATYFDGLESSEGITLSPGQRAWYVHKKLGPGGLGDLMYREYPSTPEEAFRGSVEGAYYAEQMDRARSEGRVGRVAYDATLPVYTFWDLGMADATAIWFCQVVGMDVRIIDYLEGTGKGLPWYVQQVKGKSYVYGDHYAPHDIAVREFGAGVSRLQTARDLGIDFRVVPKHQLPDGIDAVRAVLPHCWFDLGRCERGIECLEAYRKKWNEHLGDFDDKPQHDWASHAADAFRYLAVTYRYDRLSGVLHNPSLPQADPVYVDTVDDYDPLEWELRV